MKPDKFVYLFSLIALVGWGLAMFVDKLATNRLGNKVIYPLLISYALSLIVLVVGYLLSDRLGIDKRGMVWLLIGNACYLTAGIAWYLLLTKSEVSWAIPVTALYPVITILLAFIVLKETLSFTKIAGILLSLGAVVLLSL